MKRSFDTKAPASPPGVVLEHLESRVPVRFSEVGDQVPWGDANPIELDALVARCLQQTRAAPKRRRTSFQGASSPADVGLEAEETSEADQRIRRLRELRQTALTSIRSVEKVAELLHRTLWRGEDSAVGGQTRFLRLHPSYTQVPEPHWMAEGVATSLPSNLRLAGEAVANTRRHGELEGTLRVLHGKWPLKHLGGGVFSVEVWSDSLRRGPELKPAARNALASTRRAAEKKSTSHAYHAFLQHRAPSGVCVTFPWGFGRLVQFRHRLHVRISPLDAGDRVVGATAVSSQSASTRLGQTAPFPLLSSQPSERGLAIDAALREARDALVDLCAFRRLRESLITRVRLKQWHILRASSAELLFAVPVATQSSGERLLSVAVRFGASVSEDALENNGSDLWEWLSAMARLRLRELLLGLDENQASGSLADDVDVQSQDLLASFVQWATPHFEAVAKHHFKMDVT